MQIELYSLSASAFLESWPLSFFPLHASSHAAQRKERSACCCTGSCGAFCVHYKLQILVIISDAIIHF